ncbi:YceI family protein [Halopseudomonas pachastrellae]|uniref:YceI family protein n=1 Tax=Halopseudomonas pachastrellae TaxID=254161 RepID=UPI003D7D004E|tara:strand:+ start:1176 stop:1751 length:576 start_codon:yes stop_codon:yes gene_type:complete
MKKLIAATTLGSLMMAAGLAQAADYQIDKRGQHASVNFKISHLGYSWIYGRFNDFDGTFSWDADKPEASSINVTVNTESVDTNHAERDKHIRGEDFLNVEENGTATFASTGIEVTGDSSAKVTGNLTLNGVTKPVVLDANFIGEGEDPWGGYRAGFDATTTLKLADFGIDYNLGPASETVELIITVEGVRQ